MNIWLRSYILKSSGSIAGERHTPSCNMTVISLLFCLLVLLAALSIRLGSSKLSTEEIIRALINTGDTSNSYRIIKYVRIPRTSASVLAGTALSISGLILQTVLNNYLAGPNVIGVNAGSGLFVVLVSAFFPSYYFLAPLAAFFGALIAVLFVYFISLKTGASRMTIVLSGIAVSSFIGSITDTVLTLVPEASISRTSFMIGGFSGVTSDKLSIAAFFIFAGFLVSMLLSGHMNVLSLGDETAKSLGLNVEFYRFVFLSLAALLCGSAISFSGLLGFIGLIVPHAARFLVGYDNRFLIAASALLGSCFTVFCDILSRVLFAPFEIPVGIIMSFLGGPFFIYLLMKKRRSML
ncbi:MAG: iron ABC transporter permease [Sedimentibacter sp.]|uniref:FecCD family ABC transporter permease n=1 Tax=Sedimentibacter sp. TaxID=1960295 RepID=UPI0031596558